MTARQPVDPPRILVADDDAQVRKLFARKLRSAGYSVTEAKTGDETLASLRNDRYRVVVLDLDMPGTDGFEVLKTARTEWPHLRVLAVSGFMKGALLEAAECFGAAATIDKVRAPGSILPMVHRLLGDG